MDATSDETKPVCTDQRDDGIRHDGGDDCSKRTQSGKLDKKTYGKSLRRLQADLVQLQLWVQRSGAKVCILFEGRDGAGKGGTIKAIMERTSPRVFRVVALPAPTERE